MEVYLHPKGLVERRRERVFRRRAYRWLYSHQNTGNVDVGCQFAQVSPHHSSETSERRRMALSPRHADCLPDQLAGC